VIYSYNKTNEMH